MTDHCNHEYEVRYSFTDGLEFGCVRCRHACRIRRGFQKCWDWALFVPPFVAMLLYMLNDSGPIFYGYLLGFALSLLMIPLEGWLLFRFLRRANRLGKLDKYIDLLPEKPYETAADILAAKESEREYERSFTKMMQELEEAASINSDDEDADDFFALYGGSYSAPDAEDDLIDPDDAKEEADASPEADMNETAEEAHAEAVDEEAVLSGREAEVLQATSEDGHDGDMSAAGGEAGDLHSLPTAEMDRYDRLLRRIGVLDETEPLEVGECQRSFWRKPCAHEFEISFGWFSGSEVQCSACGKMAAKKRTKLSLWRPVLLAVTIAVGMLLAYGEQIPITEALSLIFPAAAAIYFAAAWLEYRVLLRAQKAGKLDRYMDLS